MTTTSTTRRRVLAATAAAGLALGGLALTGAPASAAAFAGTYGESVTFGATGAGCGVTSSGTAPPSAPFAAGVAVPINQSSSSTGTGPTPSDTASLAAGMTGSMIAHEAGGALSDFDVSGTANAAISRGAGASATCAWNAATTMSMTSTFSLGSGLLDVDTSQVGSGYAVGQLIFVKTTTPVTQGYTVNIGQFSRRHELISLTPGDYQMQVVVMASATSTTSPGQPGPVTSSSFKIHGVVRPFGAADNAATGTALKYLTLGDAVSCANHSVTADFTDKAGKAPKKPKHHKKPKHQKKPVIKKATFFVNGVAAAAVSKPSRLTLVTLPGIPDDEVSVTAQLTLSGGKGTVTLERDYLPCS